ncbi:TlpA family protein disulfide reductase [Simplicispira suum]|uniref:Redoxin n=1 Tax=Simplicispira suum TaxID=2109915 RepID=A0A2S0N0R6_9BURK|nr:TlpA disulfide reductase family protein [Simplicispira suum]AVO41744.1 redoxin [Simplicispira suum]MBW7832654.1 TlpA family protein disulfide reductase [Simplicispira suum]
MTEPLRPSADVPGVPHPSRRRLLYAGVAAAAAATGAAWAWWRLQPHGDPAASAGDAAFFEQSFETPDGVPLVAAAFHGKPLLLNFWATWCPPCIAELPLLNGFYGEQRAKGWQVLGLAVDKAPAVRKFLERSPVDFPIGMAGLSGTELSRSLGNLAGGLPFSVVFAADGRVVHRKMGQIKPEDLQAWTATVR